MDILIKDMMRREYIYQHIDRVKSRSLLKPPAHQTTINNGSGEATLKAKQICKMSTTATETPPVPFKLTEINPESGAEVTHLTFSSGVSDETFRLLEDAVTKVSFYLWT